MLFAAKKERIIKKKRAYETYRYFDFLRRLAVGPSIPSPHYVLSEKCCQIVMYLISMQHNHTLNILKHTLIIITVFVPHLLRQNLVGSSARLQLRCQPGLGSHLEAWVGKGLLPTHSGCGQNSVLCSCRGHGSLLLQSHLREQVSKANLLSRQKSYTT